MTSELDPHNEMNTIIHHGLRRDLDRAARVLARPVTDAQRASLCRHITWMLDYLHRHHVGEDEGVWPRTLAKRPDLRELVDEMEAEHEALAAASDQVRAASDAFARDGSEEGRRELAEAVAHMQATTLPHLDHEEQVAMPLVLETLDDTDWDYLEKNHFRKGVGLADLGPMGMWLLDDLNAAHAAVIRAQFPRPVLWFLTTRYGAVYDRDAAVRWGDLAGTRA